VKSRPVRAARSARNARRKPSLSKMPCQVVPRTLPSSQPSRNGIPPATVATPWWISYPLTGSPSAIPAGRASVLAVANFICAGSRPRPGTVPAWLSTSSSIEVASISYPPQIPSTGRPQAARSVMAAAMPVSRSQPRSLTVARLPGRITRSAPARWPGVVTRSTATPGSAARGSRSVTLDIRGSRTTAIRRMSAPTGCSISCGRVSRSRESSASSHRSRRQGSTPYVGRPVIDASMSRPGASSRRSPRNLLTMNPAISRWSAGSSTASVPNIAASSPPRSMSPTTTTGRAAARARPIFARSRPRRLISAGLPAPSQMTTSKRRRRSARLPVTAFSSAGLRSW
jgi:hypothetical protein